MASSDRPVDLEHGGPADRPDLTSGSTRRAVSLGAWRSDGAARWLFIWPAVLLILFLSIFPLVASLALSFSRVVLKKGGVDLNFIGLTSYNQLLFGTERVHFLGLLKNPNPLGWAFVAGTAAFVGWRLYRAIRSGTVTPVFLVVRALGGAALVVFVFYLAQALVSDGGRPGALIVTLFFVVVGIARAAPAGPRPGHAGRAAAALPALLPGRLPDPADDHAGRASATCSG